MKNTDITITTSPKELGKYIVGETYIIEIGNHLIMAMCISANDGVFDFDEVTLAGER